ncbi:hypothetical protein M0805_006690 [Coniferiporia weirii]|nr:hypothetical protein M0805_006690 [Coniferiporia weirii]
MGFLKRLLSIGNGGKNKNKRDRVPDSRISPSLDLRPTLHPSTSRNNGDESEAAVSRLLRSSSAHFNVVSEADYDVLPPIPHPINTVSSTTGRSQLSRDTSVPNKSSYIVKVHKRQQLSSTVFPNAYPPLTPHRPAHKSTPNLHETPTVSNRPRQVSDPRKVPITPRDIGRLSRLRQDPSVASLLCMYDDRGRLDDNAFSNTPPPLPSNAARRRRRESTFKELLGDDASEADLSWAERCIAGSNGSTSTLSSVPSPTLESPDILAVKEFDDGNAHRAYLSDSSEAYEAISSMVVELSLSTTNDDSRITHDMANITVRAESKMDQQITRIPSQRASQVFNFLSEKRGPRRSDGPEEVLRCEAAKGRRSSFRSRAISEHDRIGRPITSTYDDPEALIDELQDMEYPVNPLSAHHLAALSLPAPAPPSPVTFRPLNPAPRARSRSTGAADMLRTNTLANGGRKPHVSRRHVAGSTGADAVLYAEFERERRIDMGRDAWHVPHSSTPHVKTSRTSRKASGTKRSTSRGADRPILSVLTNGHTDAEGFERDDERPKTTRLTRAEMDPCVSAVRRGPSYAKRYDAFVANLEGHQRHEKENGRQRKRAAPTDLARAATTSSFAPPSKSAPTLPLTPTRSRSLLDPASPVSSSELSPEATQLMADLRARKLRAGNVYREHKNHSRLR